MFALDGFTYKFETFHFRLGEKSFFYRTWSHFNVKKNFSFYEFDFDQVTFV